MHHYAKLLFVVLKTIEKNDTLYDIRESLNSSTTYTEIPTVTSLLHLSGAIPFKETSDNMQRPLLTLPPHQLRSIILINLKSLLRGEKHPSQILA